MRLDKYISSQGNLSRTDAKKLIKQGLITVDSKVVTDPGFTFDENVVSVCKDGVSIAYKEHIYIMLNKPQGVVSASTDKKQKTVVDLVPPELYRDGLFPAGRLDGDTAGFVLITDDGDYAHRILSPKNHVSKTYLATLADEISQEDMDKLENGITLKDGYVCLPAKVTPVADKVVEIVICEGKYHQIKRMFAACGNRVESLKRIKIGELMLDESLAPGECKELSVDDLQLIR